MTPNTVFKVVATKHIDHDHRLVMTLLYLPIIGSKAYTLYMTLCALLDRSQLRSPSYPHAFLFDILQLQKSELESARKKLEACGLLESYQGDEDYVYELYLPLSAEMFIKDSPFAPYVLKNIGQNRFDELLDLFKIRRIQLGSYDNITVSFDDVFTPAYEAIKPTTSQYIEGRRKVISMHHDFDVDVLIESLPDHLIHQTTKTKRIKERLYHLAYIYALDESSMRELLQSSLNADTSINFSELIKQAQKRYQAKPKNKFTKKTSGYDIDYFKSTHPKTIVEDLTGMHVPQADLKIIDRILTEADMQLEVINVLVAYVLKELDNQFPVFNYFEKVIAEWKRAGVSSAEAAVEHIKKRKQKIQDRKKSISKKRTKTLPKDVEVDWFDDYLKEQNKEK